MSHASYWNCPYCGHRNGRTYEDGERNSLVYCDPEEGGCDGLVVLSAKIEVVFTPRKVEGEGAQTNGHVEPVAVPVVKPNPSTPLRKEAGQEADQSMEERIETAWKELQSGQRRDLRGFRRDLSTPLLQRELERVYSVYGRPFTQPEWDAKKASWATEAVALVRNLGTTWTVLQMGLENSRPSEITLGTLSGG